MCAYACGLRQALGDLRCMDDAFGHELIDFFDCCIKLLATLQCTHVAGQVRSGRVSKERHLTHSLRVQSVG
jgi:hypothetical protein